MYVSVELVGFTPNLRQAGIAELVLQSQWRTSPQYGIIIVIMYERDGLL